VGRDGKKTARIITIGPTDYYRPDGHLCQRQYSTTPPRFLFKASATQLVQANPCRRITKAICQRAVTLAHRKRTPQLQRRERVIEKRWHRTRVRRRSCKAAYDDLCRGRSRDRRNSSASHLLRTEEDATSRVQSPELDECVGFRRRLAKKKNPRGPFPVHARYSWDWFGAPA